MYSREVKNFTSLLYLTWLQETEPKVVKKSKLGQAIAYSLSNWDLPTNYLKDGQCELSNNRAESAKLNGPNTFYYMKYLFEQLPNTELDRPGPLDHLLPWSEEIPAECKLQKKL